MLRLSEPHNQPVIQRYGLKITLNIVWTHEPFSIQAHGVDELVKMSRHPISSRVLDAFLDSPSVPIREKRKFLLNLIGQYHALVDDRIGSRVGDRCWACADPFLKVHSNSNARMNFN